MTRLFIIFFLIFMSACSSEPKPDFSLKNTYWALTTLNNKSITNFDGQPPIHIIFHINGNIVHGSDGCNSIRSEFYTLDEIIKFQDIFSTKIACAKGIAQAHAFTKALKQSDTYQINADALVLFHNKIEIARFEAKEDY